MRQKTQRGFTLIEMLIAIVIFSIGMIGIALLQVRGMSYTKDAGSRSQATILGRALADRMRSTMQLAIQSPIIGNVDGMETVDYRYPGSPSCPSACPLQVHATADIAWMVAEIANALPPPVTGDPLRIVRATAPSQLHTITITWSEAGVNQSMDFEVLPL
jgi:type IV pilus assembly protein PilV